MQRGGYKTESPLFDDWWHEEAKSDAELAERIKETVPEETILAPNSRWRLAIDYPLTHPFLSEIQVGAGGMTRREFINFVVECYKRIYAEEKATSKIKVRTAKDSFNRNKTDGKYGIWGHEIGDLVLHAPYINGDVITVGVDS